MLATVFRSTVRDENREDKSESFELGGLGNRNRGHSLRTATSQRRRFKEKSEAWNAEATFDASVSRTNQPVERDNSKAFIDYGNDSSAHTTSVDKNIEVSGQNHPILGSDDVLVKSDMSDRDDSIYQTIQYDNGGDEMKSESSDEAEDEDEEEMQEDRNKAVEWTEDDQKNLMDLGLSEIERNRRLESLIARRRARKSNKRKVEGIPLTIDLIPSGQIAKLVTTKNDAFDIPNRSEETEGVPIPGSAPSVLLPMRNPFDLPYDPLEEKPNLMADSFQQEFTESHQRELSFCRHESFCFGPAFPPGDEGGKSGDPRFRRPSDKGDQDWLIEQLLFKGDQVSHAEKIHNFADTGGESFIQAEDSFQIKDGESTETLNMTDINELEMESAQGKKILPDTEQEFKTEPQLIENSSDESSPLFSSEIPEDVISINRAVVSQSFGSILSTTLNKSLKCVVPKTTLTKEPLCSFSPSAFERNKMEDSLSFQDKVVCHTPTYSIASDLQVEVSELGSPSLTVDGNNSPIDGESLNHDWEIEKEMNFGGEELWGTSSEPSRIKEKEFKNEAKGENINKVKLLGIDIGPENVVSSELLQYRHEQVDLDSLPEEVHNEIILDLQTVNLPEEVKAASTPDASAPKTIQSAPLLTKELMDQPPEYILPQKPENLSNPPDDFEKAINEDIDGGLQILMKQDNDGKKTRKLEETYLQRRKLSVDHEDPCGCQADLDPVEPSLHGSNIERLVPSKCETREQSESMKDNENQINYIESEFQNSNDAMELTMEKDSVPLDPSPCSSISAVEEQIHVQFSSSTSNDLISDATEYLVEDMVKIASSNKLDLPSTVQELEDSITQSTNLGNVEKFQEPTKPLMTHEEEEHTINNLNETIVNGETRGQNSNSEFNAATERESDISTNEDGIISHEQPIEESILGCNDPKFIEEDDNKAIEESIAAESEIIRDLSELNGEKSNVDAISESENTLTIDADISENVVETEVATNPLMESPAITEVQMDTEQIPTAGNGEFDKGMEGNSTNLNGNEDVN